MKNYNIKTYTDDDILYISPSKLNLFLQCPAQYFFRYLTDTDIEIEQTVWPGTGFGVVTHQILEELFIGLNQTIDHSKISEAIIDKRLWTNYYDLWLKKHKNEFKKSRGYKYDEFIIKGEKFSKLLTNFILQYFCGFFKILPEFKFEIEYKPVDNVVLRGIIDALLFYTEKQFKILDFKTTKDSNKFYFVNWEQDVQSLIYIYYVSKQYELLPESFDYLVLNHEEKSLFFKEQLIDTEQKIDYLTDKIKDIKEYTLNPDLMITNPSEMQCKWCDYKIECKKSYKSKYNKLLTKKMR